jgi:hypothetical protein
MIVVSGWRTLLDDAAIGGKRQAVLCSDVQKEVFPEPEEGGIDPHDADRKSSALTPQELGMVKAKQREDTRRAARLIYHFGFRHFAPAGQSVVSDDNITTGSKVKLSSRKKGSFAVGSELQDAKVEAMQHGKVIQDVTLAKGEWGLRYRRD